MKRICTKKEFERELEEAGDRLVAVDFTATWCTRRDDVKTRLNNVVSQPEFSEVLFLQVDVDDNEDTPPFCQIDFLPTIQFYRFGHKLTNVFRLQDTYKQTKSKGVAVYPRDDSNVIHFLQKLSPQVAEVYEDNLDSLKSVLQLHR